MAVFGCWRNGFIAINGVDLSDHAREISMDLSIVELPSHTHGDDTVKVRAGLEDWTINVTFLQDFAAGEVDDTFRGAGSLGTVAHQPFNIEVGPDAGTVSATNPRYSGNVICSTYRPFGGPHGSNMEAQATFRCGGGQITRRTTP